jgi:hypothetical protein
MVLEHPIVHRLEALRARGLRRLVRGYEVRDVTIALRRERRRRSRAAAFDGRTHGGKSIRLQVYEYITYGEGVRHARGAREADFPSKAFGRHLDRRQRKRSLVTVHFAAAQHIDHQARRAPRPGSRSLSLARPWSERPIVRTGQRRVVRDGSGGIGPGNGHDMDHASQYVLISERARSLLTVGRCPRDRLDPHVDALSAASVHALSGEPRPRFAERANQFTWATPR